MFFIRRIYVLRCRRCGWSEVVVIPRNPIAFLCLKVFARLRRCPECGEVLFKKTVRDCRVWFYEE